MKSTTDRAIVAVAKRGFGDEAFVNFNVRMGSMVANATADVGARPAKWTVYHLGTKYPGLEAGEVRGLSRMRGRKMEKILKAIEAGRI